MPANSLKRRLGNAVADADARLREDMRATETHSGGESASGRRGNLRQRIERASVNPSASSSSTGPAQPFPLVDSLKKHWEAGRLSSPMVQEIATGAAAQGATGGGVDQITRAASEGLRPDNLQRSLLSLFGRTKGVPLFRYVMLPLKRGTVLHPTIMPHEFFSTLYKGSQRVLGYICPRPSRSCS